MALWDILKNLGNKQGSTNGTGGVLFQNLLGRNKQNAFDEYAQNMPALKLPDNTTPSNKIQLNDNIGIKSNTKINSPDLDSITGGAANTGTSVTGLQLSPDGMSISEVSVIPENKGKFKNFKLSDALLGKRAQSTDNIGTLDNDSISVGISSSPRIGGILNDLNAGMNENYNNKFDINNWQDNQLADGRKKGAAYRIGEGLGSLARGLATWGGDAFTAGTQGLDAAMKRQSYRTGNQLYRQQLKDNYGFTDEQLNKVTGIIDSNTFNNLTKSQNSAMNLALKQQTTQSMNRLRELQIEKQRIINSTLPEMQKAKLLKANAEAAHAEEMQLARINYYNNAAANPLGWANFGLKVEESDRKNKESKAKQDALKSLIPDDSPKPKSGATKSGNKWEEVD